MSSDTLLYLQSTLARGLLNIDSLRHHNISLEKRTEGWTEVWGVSTSGGSDDWRLIPSEALRRDIQVQHEVLLATPFPQEPLTLVQFRPAWFEQLLLRNARVPHVVVNSPYPVAESTGALPYLLAIDMKGEKCPALVGRYQPGKDGPSQANAILDYLENVHQLKLSDDELSERQRADAFIYANLIEKDLRLVLETLRWEDEDAWENVYRDQFLKSGSGRLTIWCMRSAGRYRCRRLQQSVAQAKTTASLAYSSLNSVLEGRDNLLGTTDLQPVDALLFDHLANALCDVHLVTILPEYKNLVKFFERTYQANFRFSLDSEEWLQWNDRQNLENPFQQLPMERPPSTNFRDALELMQSLSLQKKDLQAVLDATKATRNTKESAITRFRREDPSTWYRWRMGGDAFPKKQNDEDASETPQQAKYRKDHKKNDELWISGVLMMTALALAFGLQSSS